MKECHKCKQKKDLELFHKNKNMDDGYHYVCKSCVKIYKDNNKELTKIYNIKKNKNKIGIKLYNKEYNILKPEIKQKSIIEFFIKNPEYSNNWKRNKYHSDLNFKINSNISSRLWHALKNNIKSKSSKKLLGCSIEEFKQYLENQFYPEMTWENHGIIWEIDHIIGCCNFDLTKLEEQEKCFHYSNQRALFKTTKIANKLGYNIIGNRNKQKIYE